MEKPKPEPPRRYHHGLLRDRLLELGETALRENRLDKTSLRDLAKLAGVSHTAPYRHFSDRDALEAALLEKEMQVLLGAVQIIDQNNGLVGVQRFIELGQKLIQTSASNPHRYELLMSSKQKPETEGLKRLKVSMSRILLRWTVDILHACNLRKVYEPLDALKLIWAAIAGAIKVGQSHWTSESPLDSRIEAQRILSISLSGIFKSKA